MCNHARMCWKAGPTEEGRPHIRRVEGEEGGKACTLLVRPLLFAGCQLLQLFIRSSTSCRLVGLSGLVAKGFTLRGRLYWLFIGSSLAVY